MYEDANTFFINSLLINRLFEKRCLWRRYSNVICIFKFRVTTCTTIYLIYRHKLCQFGRAKSPCFNPISLIVPTTFISSWEGIIQMTEIRNNCVLSVENWRKWVVAAMTFYYIIQTSFIRSLSKEMVSGPIANRVTQVWIIIINIHFTCLLLK